MAEPITVANIGEVTVGRKDDGPNGATFIEIRRADGSTITLDAVPIVSQGNAMISTARLNDEGIFLGLGGTRSMTADALQTRLNGILEGGVTPQEAAEAGRLALDQYNQANDVGLIQESFVRAPITNAPATQQAAPEQHR